MSLRVRHSVHNTEGTLPTPLVPSLTNSVATECLNPPWFYVWRFRNDVYEGNWQCRPSSQSLDEDDTKRLDRVSCGGDSSGGLKEGEESVSICERDEVGQNKHKSNDVKGVGQYQCRKGQTQRVFRPVSVLCTKPGSWFELCLIHESLVRTMS